jgi:predicted nucleic acid-binding protein
MRKVFVDTAAWIALINMSDDLHVPAQKFMGALRQQKVRLMIACRWLGTLQTASRQRLELDRLYQLRRDDT